MQGKQRKLEKAMRKKQKERVACSRWRRAEGQNCTELPLFLQGDATVRKDGWMRKRWMLASLMK